MAVEGITEAGAATTTSISSEIVVELKPGTGVYSFSSEVDELLQMYFAKKPGDIDPAELAAHTVKLLSVADSAKVEETRAEAQVTSQDIHRKKRQREMDDNIQDMV